MPTVGLFHSFYWNLSDTNVAPTIAGRGGYPLWQASVIAPSLFGAIGAWWDVQWARFQWWRRFGPRVHRLTREQRAIVLTVLDTLEAPAFAQARLAVRGTATTLGFNRPEAWKELSRSLKDSPGNAENTFRHLEACRRLKVWEQAAGGSTLTNPQRHLAVELGYVGFAFLGK